MSKVDTELSQLNIPAVLRANAAFMKILIVLFHYGNQSMDANQLVLGIETLKLLQIKGDIDETIREIIATGHRQARTAHTQPPLNITRAKMGRPTRYSISKETMNGIQPVMTKLPQDCGHSGMKRTRKATTFYTPSTHKPNNNNNNNHNNHNNNNTKKPKKKKTIFYLDEDDFE
ncbi:hypothetical protein G6F56_010405 [Rhizopus delemar]|nr:hypothetical protein G6F56_010405 [Rhizopus delemar]